MIDIRVISLRESSERRKFAAEQLDKLGVDYQFFDAIDGFGNDPLLDLMDRRRFLYRNNRYPIPREAGCYASHFRLWEQCADSGRPMLIMEDDFELTDQAVEVFSAVGRSVGQYPFIKLERLIKKKPHVLVQSFNGVEVYLYRKAPHCLLAYAISPEAAMQLVKSKENFLYPVDVFVRNFGIHGVPVFGVTPPMVDRGALNYASSTIGDRDTSGPKWARIPRLYFKMRNSIMNMWGYMDYRVNG